MLQETATEQALLARTFERVAQPLSRVEARAEIAVGAGFLAVAATLLVAFGDLGEVAPLPAACALLAMALAMHARFDFGAGYTPPTQVAFVPLLFALPPAAVPVATAAALALSDLPDVLRGRMPAGRLAFAAGNSWFTIGPVTVLIAAGAPGPDAALLLVAGALLAQFAVDFAVSSLRERIVRRTTLREELRLALPVYAVDAALAPIGVVTALAAQRTSWAVLALLPLLGLLARFARERHARLEQMLELNNAYRGTALALGDVVEADDSYTGEHSRGVVSLSLAVGRALGLDDDRMRDLEFGALLHDVGKVAIPKAVINKAGPLDPEEWELVKTHTVEGQRMLDRVGGFMSQVGLVVRSHHERYDGGGYPDRLEGEAIPIEARIITVCDSWHAMRTDRPYRARLSFAAARDQIVQGTGTQFDPRCSAALLEAVAGEAPDDDPGPAESRALQLA